MWVRDDTLRLSTTLGPPAIVAAVFYLLSFLPQDVILALMAWTLASFPIGILVGHCVLKDEPSVPPAR